VDNRTDGSAALLHKFLVAAAHNHPRTWQPALQALQKAFPLMAAWRFAVDFLEKAPNLETGLAELTQLVRAARRVALQQARRILESESQFLTLSRSSLVEAFLLELGQNRELDLICSRSRPAEEGVALAENLRRHGHKVLLVEDEALNQYVDHGRVIILGADWVGPGGFFNKIGSASLCESACAKQIPVYVLAEAYKYTPSPPPATEAGYQQWDFGGRSQKVPVFEWVPRRDNIHFLLGKDF